MGNCVCNGYSSSAVDHPLQISSSSSNHQIMIKVVTSNGGVMELYAPITADQITSEFPGHSLFRGPDPARSLPLLDKENLNPGHLYYLLPLSSSTSFSATTPYRMSFDTPRLNFKRSDPDFVSRNGVWKVRLVINPEQLSEILSQEARTEELMDSVRTVAKCGVGGGGAGGFSSASSESDQRSVSSCSFNWKGSYHNSGLNS